MYPFFCWIVFHCMGKPQILYPFVCWWIFWSLQVILYHQIHTSELWAHHLRNTLSIPTNSSSFSIFIRTHFCLFSGCEVLCHSISNDLTVLGIYVLLTIYILLLEKMFNSCVCWGLFECIHMCAGVLAYAGNVQKYEVDIRMPFSLGLHFIFWDGSPTELGACPRH